MQLQFMEIMPIPPKSQRYSCHHMAVTLFQSLVMATACLFCCFSYIIFGIQERQNFDMGLVLVEFMALNPPYFTAYIAIHLQYRVMYVK